MMPTYGKFANSASFIESRSCCSKKFLKAGSGQMNDFSKAAGVGIFTLISSYVY
jgi:hypothetical protein